MPLAFLASLARPPAAEVGNLNIYNIYGDCITGAPESPVGRLDKQSGRRVYRRAPVPVRAGGPIECIDETIAQVWKMLQRGR